ncbi:MAG TPA: hypothetical protein DCZ72_12920 [Armatimonadetes bacterium]|nr:hypothetical protein [Armatimonadota bacterium]
MSETTDPRPAGQPDEPTAAAPDVRVDAHGAQLAAEPSTPPAEEMSRRAAFGAAGVVGACVLGGASVYPVVRYLTSAAETAAMESAETEVTVEGALEMAPNTAKMFKFGGRPGILIRQPDSSFVALSAVCTHLNCTVGFEPDKERIYCTCHGGVYDPATGENISGPPPAPLTRYNVVVTDEEVTVSRV